MAGPAPIGPLAARWGDLTLGPVRAGALTTAHVLVANAGTVPWRSHPHAGIWLAYHWLDERGNAIVWDGLRTELPYAVPPGEQVTIQLQLRGALPPGRYRLAVDLVDEGRVWFGELGGEWLEREVEVAPRIARKLAARGGDAAALAAQEEPLVPEAEAEAVAYLADGAAPAGDWSRRVLDAHEEGYGLVAGAVEPIGGILERRRAAALLRPWAPGVGRVPHFPEPLLCPSVASDFEPDWIDDVAGLPAVQPPQDRLWGEPWLYDGRIVVRARPRSGRRRG